MAVSTRIYESGQSRATRITAFLCRVQAAFTSARCLSASGAMTTTRPRFAPQSCRMGGISTALTACLSTTVYDAIMQPVSSANAIPRAAPASRSLAGLAARKKAPPTTSAAPHRATPPGRSPSTAMASPVMPRFYSAVRPLRYAIKRKRGRPPAFYRPVFASTATLDHPVDDLHLVAGAPGRRRRLGEQALAAVLVADDDLVLHGLFRVLLDLVSGKAAAEHPKNRCDVLAPAAAHLVPDDAADHSAAYGPGARGLTRFLDLAHFLDHGALAADCSDDDGGSGRNCSVGGHARRLGSRDRFRPHRRLALDGLCLLGLRRGLLGRLGERCAGCARGSDRGRDPAEYGPDSHEAEQRDRDRGDDDQRMGMTCGL